MAVDVKALAEIFLGQNQEECPPDPNKCEEVPSKPDSCDENGNSKSDIPAQNSNSEPPTHDNEEVEKEAEEQHTDDVTVAMAYDIRTLNPFSSFTNRFSSLKSFFGKSTKLEEEKKTITIEEMVKTPLPKPRRKQFSRKLRQRHFISTPSIQSQIRRILTNYKYYHFDDTNSLDFQLYSETEEFHSTETGLFNEECSLYNEETEFENEENKNLNTEVFGLSENENVSKLSVSCSEISSDSSKVEYEIASDFDLLYEKHEFFDSKELLNDERDKVVTNPLISDFISLIQDASEYYNLQYISKDEERELARKLETILNIYPDQENVMKSICKLRFKALDPFVSRSNYNEVKNVLQLINIVRSECAEFSLPVIILLLLRKLYRKFYIP